jgi:cupin 2 domain-containing protein
MATGNLFAHIPELLTDELLDVLWQTPGLRVERIVSRQHASPPGFWYDQDTDEWVLLVAGSAGLWVEGQEGVLTLRPGDHVLLPAHRRHRVEWTDPHRDTVWLAVHARPPG